MSVWVCLSSIKLKVGPKLLLLLVKLLAVGRLVGWSVCLWQLLSADHKALQKGDDAVRGLKSLDLIKGYCVVCNM